MLSRPGVTCRVAAAVRVPVSVASAAVIVASPSERRAVKVVVLPVLRESVPMFRGVNVHVAETGKRFPNESRPAATNCRLARAATVAEPGVSFRDTTGPGVTVSVCVPLVVCGRTR